MACWLWTPFWWRFEAPLPCVSLILVRLQALDKACSGAALLLGVQHAAGLDPKLR